MPFSPDALSGAFKGGETMRFALVMIALLAIPAVGCTGNGAEGPGEAAVPAVGQIPGEPISGDVVTTDSGLQYYVLAEGDGAQPQAGEQVAVHYTGYLLEDGTKFDSSVDRAQPFEFVLGMGQVIQGWDEALALMKVGGKSKLIVPPDLGYGADGRAPVIPPNATLVFDVELLEIK